MKFFAFALRNVIRNGHRSVVTTAAMGFAGVIMIIYASLMEGLFLSSERNALAMNLGDIQIHAQGYRDDPDLYTRLTDPERMVAQLQQAGFHASQRLFGFALAAAGTTSAGVQLRGIDIENEATVTEIHEHLAKGQWLDGSVPHGVVIGRKLARTLGLGLGDEVVIVGQAADGSMANDLYRVRGILKSVGEEIDRAGFFMPIRSFRRLMAVPQGAHEIVVMRSDRKQDLEQATQQVAALFPGDEVLNWRALQPLLAEILDLADVNIYIMLVITYIAVAMVVLNAMLMSVFERIREFGVMKAIGVGPIQLVGLVYAETLIQVGMALLLALLFGLPLSFYFETHGIDLTEIASGVSFAGIAIDPIWRAEVTQRAVVAPIATLFIMALLAVIYPAVKAAVIQPVKAIHYR